jgi:hypothetical protein
VKTTVRADDPRCECERDERIAMLVTKQHVVEMLRRAGLPEAAEEADRSLPDPVELEYAEKFGFERFGISRDVLISRMGGSP